MRMKCILTVMVTACAAVVISGGPGLAAQAPKATTQPVPATAAPPSAMDAKCQAMMAEKEKMMTDMKAADQRLDGLLAKMSTASGMEKAAATSTVVTEIVTQERAMRAGMAKMQEGMMGHMMEHMEAGKDSMASCPMMKQPMMKQMGGMKH